MKVTSGWLHMRMVFGNIMEKNLFITLLKMAKLMYIFSQFPMTNKEFFGLGHIMQEFINLMVVRLTNS
jgi:hypothetical protein